MIIGMMFYTCLVVDVVLVGYSLYLLKKVCYKSSNEYEFRFAIFELLKIGLMAFAVSVVCPTLMYLGLYQSNFFGMLVNKYAYMTMEFTILVIICAGGMTIIKWLIWECKDIFATYKSENDGEQE